MFAFVFPASLRKVEQEKRLRGYQSQISDQWPSHFRYLAVDRNDKAVRFVPVGAQQVLSANNEKCRRRLSNPRPHARGERLSTQPER